MSSPSPSRASSASLRSRKFKYLSSKSKLAPSGHDAEPKKTSGRVRRKGSGPTHLRMGVPNGNGNAPIDAWLSRWAETKARHAAAGWGALLGAWRCEAQGEQEDASRGRERA